MTEEPLFPFPPTEVDVSMEAVRRYYQNIGKSYERARETLANLKNKSIFVYNLNIKYPRPGNPDFLLIVKALSAESGPVIAFHNAGQWADLIPGFAARIQAGAIEWRPDEYPPDSWEEVLAFHHKRSTYIE